MRNIVPVNNNHNGNVVSLDSNLQTKDKILETLRQLRTSSGSRSSTSSTTSSSGHSGCIHILDYFVMSGRETWSDKDITNAVTEMLLSSWPNDNDSSSNDSNSNSHASSTNTLLIPQHSCCCWKTGVFSNLCLAEADSIQKVLSAAVVMMRNANANAHPQQCRFQKLQLQSSSNMPGGDLGPAIVPVLENVGTTSTSTSSHLQHLTLDTFYLSKESMALLAAGLATSPQPPPPTTTPKKKTTSKTNASITASMTTTTTTTTGGTGLQSLDLIDCVFESGAVALLAKGLSQNTTLTRFRLEDLRLDDASLATLFQVGLANNDHHHPSSLMMTTTLELHCRGLGIQASRALHQVLFGGGGSGGRGGGGNKRKQISSLYLETGRHLQERASYQCRPSHLFLKEILHSPLSSLSSSSSPSSLTHLSLKCNLSTFETNLLLRHLASHFPKLQSLDLRGNHVDDWNGLLSLQLPCQQDHHHQQQQQFYLEELQLDGNPCIRQLLQKTTTTSSSDADAAAATAVASIHQLLSWFPKLGHLGREFEKLVQKSSIIGQVVPRQQQQQQQQLELQHPFISTTTTTTTTTTRTILPLHLIHHLDMNRSGGGILLGSSNPGAAASSTLTASALALAASSFKNNYQRKQPGQQLQRQQQQQLLEHEQRRRGRPELPLAAWPHVLSKVNNAAEQQRANTTTAPSSSSTNTACRCSINSSSSSSSSTSPPPLSSLASSASSSSSCTSWRQPNILFHLLQGPAFLGRDALQH